MAKHKVKPFIPLPPRRSCGKVRYDSEREAKLVAEQQELIFTNNNLQLKVYHCPYCGGWHLTKRQDDIPS